MSAALGPVAALVLLAGGCLGDSDSPDAGHAEVTVGIPDVETGRMFVALSPGGDIPLQTFGQGGYHAVFVIQLVDFGNAAWVDVTIRSLDAEGEVSSTPTRAPELLACDDLEDPMVCSRGPIIVMTSALAEIDALDGLYVEVEASARNRDGAMATHTMDGYLRLDGG